MVRAPGRLLLIVALFTLVSDSRPKGAVTERGQVRQPRNIYELVYSFQHTFAKLLTGEELKQYHTMGPKQIRKENPALYDRISQDVKGWTDEWLESVRSSGDQITPKRLSAALGTADQVNATLRRYFDSKKWPYRPMHVEFLPPRVFLDERHRGDMTSGVFIPFYPDAFFATVDWPAPLELVLVHESLHFNATEEPFGARLAEGITEEGARHIVRKYDLVSAMALLTKDIYPQERKGVEFLLDRMKERANLEHDLALETLLEAYVTGRQDAMTKIFGAETWQRVLKLSDREEDWQTHKIEKALQ